MLALMRGSQDGGIFRASLDVTPIDGLNIAAAIVVYSSGDDPPFRNLGDKDRILLGLKYYF